MKQLIPLIALISLSACHKKESVQESSKPAAPAKEKTVKAPKVVHSESIGDPASTNRREPDARIEWVEGDLTKDGIAERVEVWNGPDVSEEGSEPYAESRELRILKKSGTGWKLWYTAKNALLTAEEGGTYGDPLEGVNIERGCIVISHYGGSAYRWGFTDRFRWQNGDFYRIGHSDINHNTFNTAASFESSDENYSTGKALRIEDVLPEGVDTAGLSEEAIADRYISDTTWYTVPKEPKVKLSEHTVRE